MSSNSNSTAQDPSWKSKEQAEEANYIRRKEQEQLADLKQKLPDEIEKTEDEGGVLDSDVKCSSTAPPTTDARSRNRDEFEGGYGGQEDLEDRYATTYGSH